MPSTGTRSFAAAVALAALAVLSAPPPARAAGMALPAPAQAGPAAYLWSWLAQRLGWDGAAGAAHRTGAERVRAGSGAGIDPAGKPSGSATTAATSPPTASIDHGAGIDPDG